MANLVYIRQIDPDTVLHFATRGESACLRDYSHDPLSPPLEIRGYSASQVQSLLSQPGNHSVDGPHHSTDDTNFWHQVVSDRNDWLGLEGKDVPAQFRRLLDRFHSEVGTLVTKRDRADLRVCLSEWVNRLDAIVDKNDLFNHWDDDDCAGLCDPSTGIGWTARMLEFCRSGGQLRRIATTQPELDLALVAMELNLSISSRNNPFTPGIKDFVKPDGLGIRSDGTIGILEVKAASDCPELFRATIQALCGAVGVFAKRKLIVDLAKKPRGRRPAAGNAVVPDDAPSLGLYVMVDAENYQLPAEPDFVESMRVIIDAFAPLREIAFFSVDPTSADFPAQIPIQMVIANAVSV